MSSLIIKLKILYSQECHTAPVTLSSSAIPKKYRQQKQHNGKIVTLIVGYNQSHIQQARME